MIAVLAGLLTTLAMLTWPVARSPAARLNSIVSTAASETPVRGSPGPGSMSESAARRGMAVAAPVGVALFLFLGGLMGACAGTVAAIGLFVAVRRREPAEVRRRRERMGADLPFAVDLIVACLRAGQPMSGAVETTAVAIAGPVGERLSWVGAQMRLGAPPEEAWAALSDEPALGALARTMIRAAQSGAPVADVLTRLADDARRTAQATASAAARRVGVHAVAPLGLCFLPAFVFLGIVPMVAGLAGQILLP
ncbi:type II secretion system F family protein [Microbispora hainanensis]|jgi:pilus assembly protein TadC|uniref:Type II secretion system F family protein n=1 Tax=Microbispora hainanensis TaxID=568844 RepID=A0ABZ1SII7_9ACTN|nr:MULTISPECIES: type II secretion system F family protein [Microbispora]